MDLALRRVEKHVRPGDMERLRFDFSHGERLTPEMYTTAGVTGSRIGASVATPPRDGSAGMAAAIGARKTSSSHSEPAIAQPTDAAANVDECASSPPGIRCS